VSSKNEFGATYSNQFLYPPKCHPGFGSHWIWPDSSPSTKLEQPRKCWSPYSGIQLTDLIGWINTLNLRKFKCSLMLAVTIKLS